MTDIVTYAATAAQGDNPAGPEIRAPTNASLKIKSTKLYAPVVTSSSKDENKLLGQLKKGLKGLLNGVNTDQKCLIRLKITT